MLSVVEPRITLAAKVRAYLSVATNDDPTKCYQQTLYLSATNVLAYHSKVQRANKIAQNFKKCFKPNEKRRIILGTV